MVQGKPGNRRPEQDGDDDADDQSIPQSHREAQLCPGTHASPPPLLLLLLLLLLAIAMVLLLLHLYSRASGGGC
jgi:hypothetical protein